MAQAKRNRFAKGSGCYTCERCTRKTRSTGQGDNEYAGLCAECYDLAGMENEIEDSGSTQELLAEIANQETLIRTKGGTV